MKNTAFVSKDYPGSTTIFCPEYEERLEKKKKQIKEGRRQDLSAKACSALSIAFMLLMILYSIAAA